MSDTNQVPIQLALTADQKLELENLLKAKGLWDVNERNVVDTLAAFGDNPPKGLFQPIYDYIYSYGNPNDLLLVIDKGNGNFDDAVTISGYFAFADHTRRVVLIQFGDGTVWNNAAIQRVDGKQCLHALRSNFVVRKKFSVDNYVA